MRIADNSFFSSHGLHVKKKHPKSDVETTSHHLRILNLELDAKNE